MELDETRWFAGWLNLAYVAGALTVALTTSSTGFAGESPTPGVSLPGLESDPAGSVTSRSAAVTLLDGHVRLDLTVSTTTEATMLVLKGLQFGWLENAERYPDRQFPELTFRLNGAVVTPQDRFEAMVGRYNVTNWLRSADMDPWAITHSPPVTTAHPRNPQVLNGLRNAGAIEDAGSSADGERLYSAKWLARRVLAVEVARNANAMLQLEYDARPGIMVLTGDSQLGLSIARLYCLDEKDLRRRRANGGTAALSISEYEIATGIDNQAPSSVTLSWRAPHAGPHGAPLTAFWCGPNGRSMSARGMADRSRATVDPSGVLRVLTMAR